jgi:hypothetical protein
MLISGMSRYKPSGFRRPIYGRHAEKLNRAFKAENKQGGILNKEGRDYSVVSHFLCSGNAVVNGIFGRDAVSFAQRRLTVRPTKRGRWSHRNCSIQQY